MAAANSLGINTIAPLLKRESHYSKNDSDSDITFCRPHFTFHTVLLGLVANCGHESKVA